MLVKPLPPGCRLTVRSFLPLVSLLTYKMFRVSSTFVLHRRLIAPTTNYEHAGMPFGDGLGLALCSQSILNAHSELAPNEGAQYSSTCRLRSSHVSNRSRIRAQSPADVVSGSLTSHFKAYSP